MSLESLELTDEELELARKQVERLAYCKWEEAGCPMCDPLDFWRVAEREWISLYYLPNLAYGWADG